MNRSLSRSSVADERLIDDRAGGKEGKDEGRSRLTSTEARCLSLLKARRVLESDPEKLLEL